MPEEQISFTEYLQESRASGLMPGFFHYLHRLGRSIDDIEELTIARNGASIPVSPYEQTFIPSNVSKITIKFKDGSTENREWTQEELNTLALTEDTMQWIHQNLAYWHPLESTEFFKVTQNGFELSDKDTLALIAKALQHDKLIKLIHSYRNLAIAEHNPSLHPRFAHEIRQIDGLAQELGIDGIVPREGDYNDDFGNSDEDAGIDLLASITAALGMPLEEYIQKVAEEKLRSAFEQQCSPTYCTPIIQPNVLTEKMVNVIWRRINSEPTLRDLVNGIQYDGIVTTKSYPDKEQRELIMKIFDDVYKEYGEQ